MKLRCYQFLLTLALCMICTCVRGQLRARKNWRDLEPETVTLLSYSKYKNYSAGYGKSSFSFRYGVRSEVAPEITSNQLLYGNINRNGDSDWFTVSFVTGDRSRIKDLGELDWSEVVNVPFLPASVKPHQGIRWPSRIGTLEQSSDGQVARVAVGHMYVVHSKDAHTDLYALFRVEKLMPSDQVTISWKLVPAPKR